jgi:hypothetical protein
VKRWGLALLVVAVFATAADAPKDEAPMGAALRTLLEMNAELADAVQKSREQNDRLRKEIQAIKAKLACA